MVKQCWHFTCMNEERIMDILQENYFSSFFKYKNGLLHCEDKNVRDIHAWLKQRNVSPNSPVFVYSKNKLIHNVEGYMKALNETGRKFQLNYSLKANMNPHILSVMRDLGCSVTLVSGMELQLAMKVGFQPNFLVLNGNGKQIWEIELAVLHGCLLNIDSHFNLRQTIKACEKLKRKARVLLRINPDIDVNVHRYIKTGKSGTKFGLEPNSLDTILNEIRQHEKLQLVGLHCHLGSTIERLGVFRQSAEIMIDLFRRLKSDGFPDMQYLNLGGGLSIPYRQHAWRTSQRKEDKFIKLVHNRHSSDGTFSEEEDKRHIRLVHSDKDQKDIDSLTIVESSDIIREINEVIKDDNVTLILEPGRSLVAGAGILLTSVIGVKSSGTKNYIVIDGAMTEAIRPALYDAYHHIDLAEPSQSLENEQLFDIVGPVCESADFLGKERYLSTPHEGCLLAVFDVGAYCSSMGSNYNMRARPAEVLVDGQNGELIRLPDTFESLMEPYLSAGKQTISPIVNA